MRLHGGVDGWRAQGWSFPAEADDIDDGDLTWMVTCVQLELEAAAPTGRLPLRTVEDLRTADVTLHGYVDMGLDATGEPCLVALLHSGGRWIGIEVEPDETWDEEEADGLAASDSFVYTGATVRETCLGPAGHRRMEPFTDQGTPPGRTGFLSAEVRTLLADLPAPPAAATGRIAETFLSAPQRSH